MEFGKVQFSQGLYFGTVENGKANGYGRIQFNNGDVYVGEMKDNCMTGIGAKSTSSYISMGYFSNGQRHGSFCTIEKNVGGLYVGNYSNDKKSGQGTFVYKADEVYVGEFANDLQNGYGYLSSFPAIDSGYFVQGYFVNGKLSGDYLRYSRTKFIDGTIFYGERNFLDYYWGFGEWVDKGAHPVKKIGYHNQEGSKLFKFSGSVINEDSFGKKSLTVGNYGTYTNKYGKFSTIFGDDSMYIGNFENSNISGQGILCKTHLGKVASLYIGNFSDGRKNGKGVCVSDSFYVLENGTFSFGELDSGFILVENGEVNEKTNYSGTKSNNFSKPTILTYNGTLNGGVNPSSSSYSAPSLPSSSSSSYSSSSSSAYSPSTSSTSASSYSSSYSAASTSQAKSKLSKKAARLEEEKREEDRKKYEEEQQKLERKRKREARVANENIKKINEEYVFEKSKTPRSVLKEVTVKKETHVLPESVTKILSSAFCGDETVKKVVFTCENKNVVLEDGAFKGCKNLEIVDFLKSTCPRDRYEGYFPEEAFKDCANLKTIILPNESKYKETHENGLYDYSFRSFVATKNAFENCDDVTFIKIDPSDESETIFDKQTFLAYRLSDKLKDDKIIEKQLQIRIEKIEEENFSLKPTKDGLLGLSKVNTTACKIEVPYGVEALCDGAFDKVKKTVTEITLPKTLLSLKPGYFEGFESLKVITLPNNNISIPEKAFKDCINLQLVSFCDRFDYTQRTTRIIGKNAFENCVNLCAIYTEYIQLIQSEAFKNCSKLETVKARMLEEIESDAFVGCNKLQTVTLPKKILKKVSDEAFSKDLNKFVKMDSKKEHTLITFKQKGNDAQNFFNNIIYKIKKIFY